eukprot:6171916-Pleurochrysis_carterae.AAC.6
MRAQQCTNNYKKEVELIHTITFSEYDKFIAPALDRTIATHMRATSAALEHGRKCILHYVLYKSV